MPGWAEQINPSKREGRALIAVAVFAAAGFLVMTTMGLILGVTLGWRGSSWWQTAKLLASTVTWVQRLGLFVWASLTGILVAAGTRHRVLGLLLALSALTAGAVVPIGLVLLAGALNHVWPGTTARSAASDSAAARLLAHHSLVPRPSNRPPSMGLCAVILSPRSHFIFRRLSHNKALAC